jgi:HAD superfamily hydrolase (TIGR01509 family)
MSDQRLAVASSSIRPWVEACLAKIGLGNAFEQLITGSEVENGKPDPEIYLLAAEKLGVDPTRCLAFEDAPAGIESAKRAGMTVWAVRTEYTRGLPLPNPDREFESLADVDITDIVGVAV